MTAKVSVSGGQGVNTALRKLASRLADGNKAFVGVQSSAGNSEDGFPLAPLAAIQHYGSADGKIPPRPFLDVAIEQNQKTYSKIMSSMAGDVASGEVPATKVLDIVGLRAVGDVQEYMTNLRTPPNAASTIQAKGSSNPLIDTGNLRQSITHEVRKEE